MVGRKSKIGKRNQLETASSPQSNTPPKPISKGRGNGRIGQRQGKGQGTGKGNGKDTGASKKEKTRPVRLPKSAAISLTAPDGVSYATVLSKAKQNIRLEDLGISESLKFRRAITGAYLIEIPGAENVQKADRLQEELGKLFQDTGVKIARPIKRAEMRIRGLDDSITTVEVAQAVALMGECQIKEIKMGEIKFSPYGLGTLWLQCPLTAARKIANAGKIKIGWTSVPIELLEARPLQCYRRLEKGHVSQRCQNRVDRSGRCYRCGDTDHTAGRCTSTPKCPLCSDLGKPADHRLGAKACYSPAPKRRGKRDSGAVASSHRDREVKGTPNPLKEKQLNCTATTEGIGQEEAMIICDG